MITDENTYHKYRTDNIEKDFIFLYGSDVQWGTVLVSFLNSDVQWSRVLVSVLFSGVQWGTVACTEAYSGSQWDCTVWPRNPSGLACSYPPPPPTPPKKKIDEF